MNQANPKAEHLLLKPICLCKATATGFLNKLTVPVERFCNEEDNCSI